MKTIHHTLFIVALLLLPFLSVECKKGYSNSSQDGATGSNVPVNIWMTTPNQSKLLAQLTSVNFAADNGTNVNTITIDESTTYQRIDGFGFCLTDGSDIVLNTLDSAQQKFIIARTVLYKRQWHRH